MKGRVLPAAAGVLVLVVAVLGAWAGGLFTPNPAFPGPPDAAGPLPEGLQRATFGSGCFWCAEAVFQQLRGVQSVVPGYSGGTLENPTYEDVCTGTTGHAEVVQVTYDPQIISYAELLEAFWQSHDPTTRNRQGLDVGTQYRSVIFYHDDEQRRLAEQYRARLEEARVFAAPIVTEIVPFRAFYPAEKYHLNYYASHPRQGYCVAVIGPKVEKIRKVFKDRLKN